MAPERVATSSDQPVSFKKPPVNEVYISLQTKQPSFPADNFGELVKVFGTQYPKLNAHPKLDRNAELAEPGILSLQLEMITNLGQRFWLISEDDTRVLQIQDDRFVLNWRRRKQEAEYPRYKTIRQEFESALSKIVAARNLDANDLIDFCEVSYTNHIELPDGEDPRGQMHRIFRHLRPIDLGMSDLALEESAFSMGFRITDAQGGFMGRMRLNVTPAILRKEKRVITQAQLAYRGKPASASVESALAFCDAGHLAIVSAFDRLTTDEMHKYWGKK